MELSFYLLVFTLITPLERLLTGGKMMTMTSNELLDQKHNNVLEKLLQTGKENRSKMTPLHGGLLRRGCYARRDGPLDRRQGVDLKALNLLHPVQSTQLFPKEAPTRMGFAPTRAKPSIAFTTQATLSPMAPRAGVATAPALMERSQLCNPSPCSYRLINKAPAESNLLTQHWGRDYRRCHNGPQRDVFAENLCGIISAWRLPKGW